jgi:hypothetical protein
LEGEINMPPDTIETTDAILDSICKLIRDGDSFIPFLGSGISVPSGIPALNLFPQYILCCLSHAFAEMTKWDRNEPLIISNSWKWPQFSSVLDAATSSDAVATMVNDTLHEMRNCQQLRNSKDRFWTDADYFRLPEIPGATSPSGFPHTQAEIEIQLRYNWRFGCEMLARLFNEPEKIGIRDERVIDSMFQHLTDGREPGLPHLMLAHLVGTLRIRTILTPNFDELAEEAFRRMRIHIEPYIVHKDTALPGAHLVRKQMSIVKLHGGRYGLRADKTLMKNPSKRDKTDFAAYFEPVTGTNHLLVMGASCHDVRTRGLLEYAMGQHRKMLAFWVCFSPNDGKEVRSHFGRKWGSRLHLISSRDCGLLLFQLYQQFYNALPPAGCKYPAFWRVPPHPYTIPGADADPHGSIRDNFLQYSETVASELRKRLDNAALSRVLYITGGRGVSSVCADACDGALLDDVAVDPAVRKGAVHGTHTAGWKPLSCDCHCIWLELDDFVCPEDVFIAVLAEVARKVGKSGPGPFYPKLDAKQFKKTLEEYIAASHQKIVIFLCGRDGPGHSAGWETPDVPGCPVGYQPSSRWTMHDKADFHRFLATVFEDMYKPSERVRHVALAVLTRDYSADGRLTEHPARIAFTADEYYFMLTVPDHERATLETFESVRTLMPSKRILFIPHCIEHNPAVILARASAWIQNKEKNPPSRDQRELRRAEENFKRRERFLYAATLFRQSRHTAAMCSHALITAASESRRQDAGVIRHPGTWDDRDAERAGVGRQWLAQLKQDGIVRSKPGGFAWMHRDIRNSLRVQLERINPDLKRQRAGIHQGIADWYMKLYRSSNDPLAAIESLYHRLCCVEFAGAPNTRADSEVADAMRETALVEAITTVKMARERIVACGCFTSSYNLIVKLLGAARGLNSPRGEEFSRACHEVIRDYAREAADFRRAFASIVAIEQMGNRATIAANTAKAERYEILQQSYYKAVVLTGLRSYQMAEEEYHHLFEMLGFSDIEGHMCRWKDYSTADMRELARRWAREYKGDVRMLRLAIMTGRRYMFLEMLIAQIELLLSDNTITARMRTQGGDIRKNNSNRLRNYSEGLYHMTTELMRYVDDAALLQIENAYIRTLYGVLLGTMGRFYEAHRRLNESSAYLAMSSKCDDAAALAVSDLRRAEVYLLQGLADRENRGDRSKLGCWNDAWNCLERAKRQLEREERKDVWWWTLLSELILRTSNELQLKGAKETHQADSHAFMNEARTLIVADPFRLARMGALFAASLKGRSGTVTERGMVNELKKDLTNACEIRRWDCGKYPLDSRIDEYLARVLEDVMKA